MPRCLIISPHFPPSTVAGVHRARHLAKYLPAHGWWPTVICVDPAHHVEQLDPDLAALVPDDVDIRLAGAIPVALTRRFGLVGEIGLRGFFHLRAAIGRAIAEQRPDVVMITGSPYYPMLLAVWVQRRFGIPVVLDFQDPWVSAEGATRARLSKGGLAHRLALALEPVALRGASWVTSVSHTQNAEMAARYPWLDARRMSAIPIGGDPEDFAALRHMALTNPTIRLDPDALNFCYVGTFLPRAGEVVRVLFQAVARLERESPELAGRLRFVFVGTSNQPAGRHVDQAAHRVMPIALAEGVAHLVREYPARVPFLEALSLLTKADAILMLGSDEPHYTASKIYPGLMSGTPWLSIFHEASSAHEILSAAGGGVACAWTGMAGRGELVAQVAEGLARLAVDAAGFGRANPAAYADFTADAVAKQYAAVFEGVCR